MGRGLGPGGTPLRASYALVDFGRPAANAWTPYSVVLREDYGWVMEPSNTPLTFVDMFSLLSNVTAILVRGDAWVCGGEATGEEAVYMNDVTLYTGASPNGTSPVAIAP